MKNLNTCVIDVKDVVHGAVIIVREYIVYIIMMIIWYAQIQNAILTVVKRVFIEE